MGETLHKVESACTVCLAAQRCGRLAYAEARHVAQTLCRDGKSVSRYGNYSKRGDDDCDGNLCAAENDMLHRHRHGDIRSSFQHREGRAVTLVSLLAA